MGRKNPKKAIKTLSKRVPGYKPDYYRKIFELDFVVDKLRTAFPDQTDDFLKRHVGMVIYWYYLR